MKTTMTKTSQCLMTLGLCLLVLLKPALASDNTVDLRLSLGNSWQERNDVQIPNTDAGTRFSLANEVGPGPVNAARLEINWSINQKHGLRVLLAPLTYTETITFGESVQFAGGTFTPDEETEATYKFNSWRLGYHYTLIDSDKMTFRIGGTAKIRDAKIQLVQGGSVSAKDDLGFVPLLYLAGSYNLNDRVKVLADLDGLAGGPGRAIDLGIGLQYYLTPRWQLGAELRFLDGGADVESVYNFAQFNSASIVLHTGF